MMQPLIEWHSLKPLDVEIMKRLGTRVNLIPVVAKADTMTPEDLQSFKYRVRFALYVLHVLADLPLSRSGKSSPRRISRFTRLPSTQKTKRQPSMRD